LKAKQPLLIVAALGLTAIVIGSFPSLLYEEYNFNFIYSPLNHDIQVSSLSGLDAITINQYTMFGVAPSLSVEMSINNKAFLANTTRNQIFGYIKDNPGMQFRAISTALCIPLGLAEYHLGVLVKSGLVSFIRDGRYKRFFVSKQYTNKEMLTISLLRHKTVKRIIQTLLLKKALSHSRLAEEVAITSQALTWQMKTLRNTEFLLQVNDGLKIVYSVDKASIPILVKYLTVTK